MPGKVAVIAIGGNSLIKDAKHETVMDQYLAAQETSRHILAMIKEGWNVVVTHGNGPQVGFILRRSELAAHELHEVPLDVCGADSQGAIGYALQQNLHNVFREAGLHREVATIVCQTEVAADDPAFSNPGKPIGSFMDAEQAERRRAQGWNLIEDSNRGWRRVVASPLPLRIVELPVVRRLVDAGIVVIAAGGGGIPVVAKPNGDLTGVAAVIDKDLASALLANALGADLLLISTAVDRVALSFGTPEQRWLDHLTLAEAKHYQEVGGHFARGSMGPKIQAVVNYLERGGTEAIITNPESIGRALQGTAGTRITPS
ncbi:MAG TPA: carbamate kinase [Streptosporangiaceae bacterium]|jgi:carbamate kinase